MYYSVHRLASFKVEITLMYYQVVLKLSFMHTVI